MAPRIWRALHASLWVIAYLWKLQIFACSGECHYHNPHSAHCVLHTSDNAMYYDKINRHNDKCISSLQLRVDSGAFHKSNALCLDNFYAKLELTLGKPPWEDPEHVHELGIRFDPNKTQHALAFLKRLEIHMFLRRIDVTLFKHLPHLKHLNLSHTLGLEASAISQVLQALIYAGAPLEHLDLSWSRCFPQIPLDTLRIREDILTYLEKFPLKYLDNRGIEAVQFDVGFGEFVPGLEKLYIGEYRTHLRNSWDVESCLWLDISILPNITDLIFDLGTCNIHSEHTSCPAPWYGPDIALTVRSLDMSGKSTADCSNPPGRSTCSLNNCECHNKINNYPLLREFTQKLRNDFHRDPDVYAFPPFPLPPKLRNLSVSSSVLEDWEWSVNLAQHDARLSHLIYRGYRSLYPYAIKPWNLVSRVKNLTYLDLHMSLSIDRIDFAFVIWEIAQNLEVLHLVSTPIDDYAELFRRNPYLRVLSLTDCSLHYLPDLASLYCGISASLPC